MIKAFAIAGYDAEDVVREQFGGLFHAFRVSARPRTAAARPASIGS